jgi:DNA-binding GntR family transcriptional regulator
MNDAKRRSGSELRIIRSGETLRGRTVVRLREAILNHVFKPGERLVESNLCKLTGVSRTTIREALRQLEAEGLIEVIPQRGPVVASLQRDEAKNIYELREALEALVVRLFVERADDNEVEELAAAAEHCMKAIAERDASAAVANIDEFTDTLVRGSRNPLIASTMQMLSARLHYLRAMTTPRQTDAQVRLSLENLERIVACVRRRDAAGAAEACIARVRNAADVALRILDEDARSGTGKAGRGSEVIRRVYRPSGADRGTER